MSAPVELDIAHSLGKAEARRRIDAKFGKLADWIPGAAVTAHHWDGDVFHFTLAAMGQTIASRLEPFDTHVHAAIDLPPMLALFAGAIREKLASEGPKLLK